MFNQIPQQPDADERLEMQIQFARHQWVTAQSPDDRAAACRNLQELICRRSPEQVDRMESENGLKRGTGRR